MYFIFTRIDYFRLLQLCADLYNCKDKAQHHNRGNANYEAKLTINVQLSLSINDSYFVIPTHYYKILK